MRRRTASVDTDDGRVGLFIAGVQKAGTSSLYAYCVEHPQIVGSSVKETHFFDDESKNWHQPDYSALHALYDRARPGNRCDGTPIYVFWPPSVERINRYNAAARFVVIFRDPIERAWSQWRMNFANGEESLSFADAIRSGRSRLPVNETVAPAWRVFSYIERGMYGPQVRRLLDSTDRDRVLFLRTEDLKSKPVDVLNRVAAHLDVSPFVSVKRKNYNESSAARGMAKMTLEDVRYLQGLFRPDLSAFATLTGLGVSEWLTMSDEPSLPSDSIRHTMRGVVRRVRVSRRAR